MSHWEIDSDEKAVLLDDGWWQCMNCHEFFRHEDTVAFYKTGEDSPKVILCTECAEKLKDTEELQEMIRL